jgi:hypothetical protein
LAPLKLDQLPLLCSPVSPTLPFNAFLDATVCKFRKTRCCYLLCRRAAVAQKVHKLTDAALLDNVSLVEGRGA